MRVLVTGGTGFLGRVLVARSAARGDEVHAVWHRRSPLPRDGVTWHRADLRDGAGVAHLVSTTAPDLVFHTAYAMADVDRAVTAASADVALASRSMRARLVHLSTDVVFDGRADRPYTEQDPVAPITRYGRAKAAAEVAVAVADPDALLVRTSLLHAGAERGPQEQLVARALDAPTDVVFFTDEIRSYVAVGDLAAALLELAALPERGVLHVAGADAISRHEFACRLARSWGRDARSLRAGSSADLEPPRPQRCALDSSRATSLLTTRLRGVTELLPDGP